MTPNDRIIAAYAACVQHALQKYGAALGDDTITDAAYFLMNGHHSHVLCPDGYACRRHALHINELFHEYISPAQDKLRVRSVRRAVLNYASAENFDISQYDL